MKTPGIYTDINTQTQRTGLPTQDHRIVFVTGDAAAPKNPTPIYDTATANVVSGDNSNAGRMIAAALSVSQGVRVETVGKSQPSDGSGGDITCKPTSITLSGESDSQAGGVLTMSRNGAPKVTLQPPSPTASEEEYLDYTRQVLELTYLAQDGVSMAFVMGDFIVGIEPKQDDNGNNISVMSGIPIDGVIDYVGTPYDLKEGVYDLNRLLTAGDPTIFTPNIVPEVNTLEIYPTPDTPPELDGYYAYGGDESGEPVVIRSCAKAVMEGAGDETVCTPTTHTILYKSYWDNRVPSDGELHARYRVNNGEWIDYTASTVDGSDYIYKFFESIRLPNGDRAIELVGGTVNPAASQTPFRSYQGENKLIGASASEPFSEEQTGVVRPYPITIEFEVTQNDFNDLVYLAFGESIVAKSCAIASWSPM